MRIDRNTLRTVVPPVLALGLVALVTHPVDAMPRPPAQSQGPAATLSAPARVLADGVAVPAPAVSFQEQLRVADGRLRTAVLVGATEPAGRARVLQIPGCQVTLTPGSIGWLDCAYAGSGTLTVEVLLSDGRRMTHSDRALMS
jgi:hypothetical protein